MLVFGETGQKVYRTFSYYFYSTFVNLKSLQYKKINYKKANDDVMNKKLD